MNPGSIIIGSHAYAFLDGAAFTVPGAGTAGRNSKPGATDPAWIDLGIIESVDITPTMEKRDIFAPTPGKIRRYKRIVTKQAHDIEIALSEMSPFVFQLLFGTLALDNTSTNYNPLAGDLARDAWVKLQQYGQTDALFNTLDVYAQLSVKSAVKMADDIVKVTLDVAVMHSIYNQGTLA